MLQPGSFGVNTVEPTGVTREIMRSRLFSATHLGAVSFYASLTPRKLGGITFPAIVGHLSVLSVKVPCPCPLGSYFNLSHVKLGQASSGM